MSGNIPNISSTKPVVPNTPASSPSVSNRRSWRKSRSQEDAAIAPLASSLHSSAEGQKPSSPPKLTSQGPSQTSGRVQGVAARNKLWGKKTTTRDYASHLAQNAVLQPAPVEKCTPLPSSTTSTTPPAKPSAWRKSKTAEDRLSFHQDNSVDCTDEKAKNQISPHSSAFQELSCISEKNPLSAQANTVLPTAQPASAKSQGGRKIWKKSTSKEDSISPPKRGRALSLSAKNDPVADVINQLKGRISPPAEPSEEPLNNSTSVKSQGIARKPNLWKKSKTAESVSTINPIYGRPLSPPMSPPLSPRYEKDMPKQDLEERRNPIFGNEAVKQLLRGSKGEKEEGVEAGQQLSSQEVEKIFLILQNEYKESEWLNFLSEYLANKSNEEVITTFQLLIQHAIRKDVDSETINLLSTYLKTRNTEDSIGIFQGLIQQCARKDMAHAKDINCLNRTDTATSKVMRRFIQDHCQAWLDKIIYSKTIKKTMKKARKDLEVTKNERNESLKEEHVLYLRKEYAEPLLSFIYKALERSISKEDKKYSMPEHLKFILRDMQEVCSDKFPEENTEVIVFSDFLFRYIISSMTTSKKDKDGHLSEKEDKDAHLRAKINKSLIPLVREMEMLPEFMQKFYHPQ